MAIAKWSDELTTGVFEVDNQHKQLIKMINDLHEALSQGKGKDITEEAINFLSNYVAEHFQAEEKLMLKHGYVGFVAHKREHEKFIMDFTDLVKEYYSTGSASFFAITLQKSIVQWLVNHIMKVDKAMAKFVINGSEGDAA